MTGSQPGAIHALFNRGLGSFQRITYNPIQDDGALQSVHIGVGGYFADSVHIGGGGVHDPQALLVIGDLAFFGDETFVNPPRINPSSTTKPPRSACPICAKAKST